MHRLQQHKGYLCPVPVAQAVMPAGSVGCASIVTRVHLKMLLCTPIPGQPAKAQWKAGKATAMPLVPKHLCQHTASHQAFPVCPCWVIPPYLHPVPINTHSGAYASDGQASAMSQALEQLPWLPVHPTTCITFPQPQPADW